MEDRGEIMICQTEDGLTKIDVNMQNETRITASLNYSEIPNGS